LDGIVPEFDLTIARDHDQGPLEQQVIPAQCQGQHTFSMPE
jgi:hypothetical protein